MAVIKCSNCENDILDSEIVCPYCDCPISETLRKMKSKDLLNYSDSLVSDLTVKVPAINTDKTKDTPSDYEIKKAELLKDLDIKLYENSENDASADGNEEIAEDTADEINDADIGIIEETQAKAEDIEQPYEPEDKIDLHKKDITAPIPKAVTSAEETVKISRKEISESKDFNEAIKTAHKKDSSKANKFILAVTTLGVIAIIVLVFSLISLILGNNEKPAKENTPLVSSQETQSDADKGFELKAGILTITKSAVMKDYDSPNQTPWYKERNRIKQVVFADGIEKIGAHTFEGFEKIVSISIPDSVKKIGESAFCNCLALKEIKLISKNLEEIDDYAFTGCKNLSSISGYTEEASFEPTLKRIGIEAFKSCRALTEFKLPMYTEIGRDAFYGHGENFVIVCETTSEAYDYAIEKGIPTKLSFGDEESNNEEETSGENKEPDNKPAESSTSNPPKDSGTETNKPKDETAKPSQTPGEEPQKPNANQGGGKSLSQLLKELESASSQVEKDRILGEIDKITQ